MPGRKCILCGKNSVVTNKEGDKISYFSFPRDENLRKKWIEVCHNKIDNIITARICSDHFKEEDFLYYKHGTEEVRKKRLKCNVIPSLYVEARGGKQSKNNVNIKNSNKEISKDCLKKKDSPADTQNIKAQKSVLQTKRRSSSGNKNNKSIRVQFKRKSISEKNKIPNMLPKHKNSKGINNKENAKELTKRKNHLKKTSLGIKEISKKKNDQELIKKKNNSLNIASVKKDQLKRKIVKKSVNKENQMGTVEDRINSLSNISLKDTSKEKLNSPIVTKSNKKELNRKKNQPEINLAEEIRSIVEDNAPKEVTKDKIAENNEEKISQEISETKYSLESNSVNADVAKKTLKRKGFMGNRAPRKIHKKRIRLGKDDSDDSEESSSECKVTNHVSRDKITYKSSSQMAHNEDLLKYLNYLKEKSRSADQPILFRVD